MPLSAGPFEPQNLFNLPHGQAHGGHGFVPLLEHMGERTAGRLTELAALSAVTQGVATFGWNGGSVVVAWVRPWRGISGSFAAESAAGLAWNAQVDPSAKMTRRLVLGLKMCRGGTGIALARASHKRAGVWS